MSKTRAPIEVSKADVVFGGKVSEILPPMTEIPAEFHDGTSPWNKWQREWFFRGLARWPVAKEGLDLSLAMANLACVQGSFEPKHQHKEAGVAYLASLWFVSPDGEPTEKKTGATA
jgi:hypothetical protein